MKIFFLILCILLNDVTETRKVRKERAAYDFIDVITLLPKAKTIFKEVVALSQTFLRNPDQNIYSILLQKEEQKLIGQLISKINTLDLETRTITETTISTIFQALPKMIKLELKLNDLRLIINQIKHAEEQMQNYLILGYVNKTVEEFGVATTETENDMSLEETKLYVSSDELKFFSNSIKKRDADEGWIVEKFTLLDFAVWATGHSFNSLPSLLRRLNDLVTANEDDGLFQLIQNVSKETKSNICNLRQSAHQTIYNLYNTITVAELKGNTLLQFSYMLLKMYNKGNFTVEANLALSSYEKHSRKKLEVIRNTLADADRTMYRCDPKQYVEGVTHTKLTQLLQGYIENEVNLNPYGTCRENCQYYQYTEYNGCFKNQFCANQKPCSGKVIQCRYVDSDMNICTSSDPDRRYDWVEYENGKTLGNKGVCQKRNFFKVDSWWRYLFWHCSYCLCLCDDSNQKSDRYFNLRDVTSDVENNKIVTGLRIVKKNQIIHFQIQQGVLTPLGIVNQTSLSWKPVENYTVYDNDAVNEVDYYTMNWLERAIDVDEVFGPPEHVVTGLRFRKIGTHLNLEIRVTPINFTTGELLKPDHSYWLGNDNTEASLQKPRTEIQLTNPDIPIRNGPHTLNSKHDQYIQFQPTSFETDAGQNTVPYLDSQALTSQGFPLSGIGLIHRGKLGSGGFLAPKLISYDFLPHLRFSHSD